MEALRNLGVSQAAKMGIAIPQSASFVLSEYGQLTGKVVNSGSGPTYVHSLQMEGPAIGDVQKVSVHKHLAANSKLSWKTPIKPSAIGCVPLKFTVLYTDIYRYHSLSGMTHLAVHPRVSGAPDPGSFSIGNMIHGDQVVGDVIESGGTKKDDSITLQKGLSEEGPDPFKICPYCGKQLNLPKTPKLCPYCIEQLM